MENRTNNDDAMLVHCPACGEYVITDCDRVNLRSERLRSQWNAAHLSALLREQSVRKLPRFWLQYGMDPYGPLEWDGPLAPISLDELLARWPRTVPERLERTLCNLAALSPTGGHSVRRPYDDIAIAFAESEEEADYHIRSLIACDLIDWPEHLDGLRLTPAGWERYEDITQGKSNDTNPVFVAMWFGDDKQKQLMDALFQQAIQPAIKDAGYKGERVDLVEHNDWIMDKVLGSIRTAPFVIADFTGHRNGVYFEAGFARGLGIPVIHTCQADELDNAHFDTKQLNHVKWESVEELRQKLYYRIVGSIGRGPYAAQARRQSG